jgi:GAF domain-containing protein
MAFAAQLHQSLDRLDQRLEEQPREQLTAEAILNAYIREVDAADDFELITAILLLDEQGRHLAHCAAPSLPASYCAGIDGSEIGPAEGSCGTAAFVGHSIYVTDIASDPLWIKFRELALSHGLRACWSTPIFDDAHALLGTFAIYYRSPRAPRADEVDAINAISHRVAAAAHRYS